MGVRKGMGFVVGEGALRMRRRCFAASTGGGANVVEGAEDGGRRGDMEGLGEDGIGAR